MQLSRCPWFRTGAANRSCSRSILVAKGVWGAEMGVGLETAPVPVDRPFPTHGYRPWSCAVPRADVSTTKWTVSAVSGVQPRILLRMLLKTAQPSLRHWIHQFACRWDHSLVHMRHREGSAMGYMFLLSDAQMALISTFFALSHNLPNVNHNSGGTTRPSRSSGTENPSFWSPNLGLRATQR